ncbi:hypothetical protein [Streptomyces sp. NPDC017890]|uniref:hypothetical protein n=1 Tax=Streptomyces sp. NPDC017890 TaxID=3365015 RepID=UPI0037882B5C
MTTSFELPDLVPSRTAAPIVLQVDDICLRWVMPEIFHDLPVQARDDDEAVQLLEELGDKVLPGAEYDDKTKFGVMCALALDDLSAAGVEHAAICLTVEGGIPCIATISVSLVESPEVAGIPAVVRAISSSLNKAEAGEISVIELPCGAAVSCIGNRDASISGELMSTEDNVTLPTSYIRVYVPLPNHTTVVMELSTPTMSGWDMFSTMFGNIVSSIRLFHADGSPLITSAVEA